MRSRDRQQNRSRRGPDSRRDGRPGQRAEGRFGARQEKRQDKPRQGKSRPDKSREERPYRDGPRQDRPREERPFRDRPRQDKPRQDRPHQDRPYRDRPRDEERRPRREDGPREDRPRERVRDEKPAAAPLPTNVQTVIVSPDEDGMRVDRFFESRFAGLSFSHIQRIIRKGEVRVNGKRIQPKDRLEAGQSIRVPPLRLDAPRPGADSPAEQKDRAFIKSITLFEDDDVMVLNKPMGLAVQGGSGTTRHIDGMLGAIRSRDGQRPRLVHRLDKDTAGCLLVAKNRFSAAALAKTFRSRSARKIYWALVPGVPKPKQGRISTYLAKEEREDDSIMRVADHGEEGASHAITYYAVVDTAAHKLSWLSLKPVTGRTHQLRVQMAHIGHPLVGDPKYFNIENWEMPGGLQNKLHLLARRIYVPHPRGGVVDITAPLPPHMEQSWNLLGFDAKRYDPIEDAPEK